LFKSNDIIGESSIDMKNLIEDCVLVKKPLTLNEKYYKDVLKPNNFMKLDWDEKDKSRFWVPLKAKNAETGKEEVNGYVKMQIDIWPADQASKNPVGKAREQPNHSPTLPEPEGRFELSLNPFKMFNQLIGPEVRRKIYMLLCCAVCLLLCAAILPNILGTIIAQAIF
jgi:hypothetical protein